jgi:hypothetical protein
MVNLQPVQIKAVRPRRPVNAKPGIPQVSESATLSTESIPMPQENLNQEESYPTKEQPFMEGKRREKCGTKP